MKIKNMTLRTQLNGIILSILALSFIGSVWINSINSQHFINEQLASHAQDTATSLGLSLSDPLFNEETIVVEATINAIFDRGFYHHITLESIEGEVIYQRIINNKPEEVPAWFINLFPLTAPEKTSMIDTGWTVGGVLKVQSHTGIGYTQLWKSTNDITHATLIIFVFALLLAYLLLQKMYRPIKAISLQAAAIQKRQFIMIKEIPNALELKNFVIAMNKMVSNIKSTFDELTKEATETHNAAYIDQQTGLENRRAFIDAMDALLAESAQHRGYIMMVRISGLSELNKNQGYQAGDNLVKQLIEQITFACKADTELKLFRVSGSEFCLFLENYLQNKIQEFVTELIQQVNGRIEYNEESKLAFGCINFTSGELFADVMYQLDMATSQALERSEGFYIKQSELSQGIHGITNLKVVLDEILTDPKSHIKLNSQKALSLSDKNAFDEEIFAAFEYQEKAINTGDIFAIASQYQLTGELDLTIIKMILQQCENGHLKDKTLAVNLSRLTLADNKNMQQIINIINSSQFSTQLVIGLPESAILSNINESKSYIEKLTDEGCSICINRFGASMASLQYLIDIRPDQVKLSPTFTRAIDQKENNARMVSAFVRMAHGLDISVIAQCIETEEELYTLKKLKIDAALGYIIERPTLLKQNKKDIFYTN